jgi:tryptophan halogenase
MSDKMVIPRTQEEIESLEFKDISMRVGIHQRTFVKNVVAIGLSAGFIEPLESNGLFSVHEFLFKLVDILQRDKINQFDRDMYNVSIRDLFDSFAKFVALHYALSHRDDTEYWQAIQEREFRDRNNDPVSQFNNRAGSFYHFTHNYMEEWGYHTHSGGIPYIGTGMNFMMFNENRIQSLETRFGYDMERLALGVKHRDDIAIAQWKMIADQSPTLENYLYEKFYKNIDIS